MVWVALGCLLEACHQKLSFTEAKGADRAGGMEEQGERALSLWVQFLVLPLIGCVTVSEHLTALSLSFLSCKVACVGG